MPARIVTSSPMSGLSFLLIQLRSSACWLHMKRIPVLDYYMQTIRIKSNSLKHSCIVKQTLS